MRTRVYIAGPMHSSGSAWDNVQQGVKAFGALMRAGYAPFCPHLTHYIDPAGLMPHSAWMEVDLPWVQKAGAVLRLPGASKGADIEVQFAKENGIPVYYDIADLIEHLPAEAV